MFSLKITRWLMGYVRFSVLGGSPERFFNACARSGACLWEIASRRNSGACVAVGRYRRLRSCARRAGCRLRVRERHGLPFLLYRTRGHRGLFAGAAAFAAVLVVLSSRVWCIEVSGNSTLDTQAIRLALAQAGLSVGTSKSDVDTGRIEAKMMLLFPKIGWMNINTQGCIFEVSIREKADRPEIFPQDRPCDLKASATGQILSMRVYAGTPLVKEGDAVVEGQLLVSATVEDSFEGSRNEHAAAEIIAETTHPLEVRVPLRQTVRRPTGRSLERKSLELFGAHIPLTLSGRPRGDYERSGVLTDFRLFGTVLPLSLYREQWTEMRSVPLSLSRKQALGRAAGQLENYGRSLPEGTKILSVQTKDTEKDGTLVVSYTVRCEENIARESEMLIKS